MTVFYDARSNKVVSFLVRDASPNATAVKQCLRVGMERFGVPSEVYFDNGKAGKLVVERFRAFPIEQDRVFIYLPDLTIAEEKGKYSRPNRSGISKIRPVSG